MIPWQLIAQGAGTFSNDASQGDYGNMMPYMTQSPGSIAPYNGGVNFNDPYFTSQFFGKVMGLDPLGIFLGRPSQMSLDQQAALKQQMALQQQAAQNYYGSSITPLSQPISEQTPGVSNILNMAQARTGGQTGGLGQMGGSAQAAQSGATTSLLGELELQRQANLRNAYQTYAGMQQPLLQAQLGLQGRTDYLNQMNRGLSMGRSAGLMQGIGNAFNSYAAQRSAGMMGPQNQNNDFSGGNFQMPTMMSPQNMGDYNTETGSEGDYT